MCMWIYDSYAKCMNNGEETYCTLHAREMLNKHSCIGQLELINKLYYLDKYEIEEKLPREFELDIKEIVYFLTVNNIITKRNKTHEFIYVERIEEDYVLKSIKELEGGDEEIVRD